MRDVAVRNALVESGKRKDRYDKASVERSFDVGSKVLCRIPGMVSKLQDSWDGPYTVLQRTSAVNYKIEEIGGRKKSKTVHVNNLKGFRERELEVCALTVVAEDSEADDRSYTLHVEECEGYVKTEIQSVLANFQDVISEVPGKTNIVLMDIKHMDNTPVISQMPYRLPDLLKAAVKEELDDLLNSDIIEASDSPWASPLVLVAKPNGKVRLCIDFWKLNLVTPQQQSYIPCLDDILDRVCQS